MRSTTKLGVELEFFGARNAAELESTMATISRHRPDGLHVWTDRVFGAHRTRIAQFTAANRLPDMYGLPEHADAGGLMSYGVDYRGNFRQCARHIDRGART